MTIQSPDSNDINLGAAAAGAEQQTAFGQAFANAGYQQPDPNQQPQQTVSSLLNTFAGRSRAGSSDAEVAKVATLCREYFEQEASQFEGFRVINVSSQQTGNFGAVVIASEVIRGTQRLVYVYTLMIEKSKQVALDVAQINIGNRPVEVFVSTNDAYNSDYVAKVTDVVRRTFNNSATITAAGASVVYNITSLEKDEFQPMIDDAINAIDHAQGATTGDETKFNLSYITGNSNLRIRSHISLDQPEFAPNGIPIRSDIKSELVITENAKQNSIIANSSELRVCKTNAYVDLIYVPPTQGFFGGMAQQYQAINAPQPYYIPRIVITNFGLDLPHSALEFMLLGMASVVSLARQRSYGIVWRDNFGSASNNLRNIGAVGLQVPGLTQDGTPAILDVSGNIQSLYALMETVMAPDPIITLELTQGGQSNWVTNIIAKAAAGDIRAQELLVTAADNLTLGKFSPIYAQLSQGTGVPPIVTTSNEPSYIGYYKRDGELRDIRELDLIAVLNLIGQKDPDMVSQYLATLASNELPQIRLDVRARILKSIAKDVTFKGYSKKYDFGGKFIQALTQAINACGVVINNDNILGSNESVYTQTIGQWQQNMVSATAVSPLFTQQPLNVPNAGFQFGNIFNGYGY